MGSGASKMGDLFYWDNPKRRARASQLKDDIQDYARQFEEAKKERDATLKEIKPLLKKLLNKYGYNSPEELDQAVKKTLEGEALKEYLRISEKLDKSDEVVSNIFQILGIISVASGVVLGGLVVLTVITGGAALAAIGAIGAVLGIVATALILFSVFEGAEERSNMQKAIHDLSFERVKARAALEGMKAISAWLESIKFWLEEPLISENEQIMKKKIEGNFTTDFNKSKRPYVIQYLKNRDRERSAWTNEDPNWWDGPNDILPVGGASASFTARAKIIPGTTTEPPSDSVVEFLTKPSTIDLKYASKHPKETGLLELTFISSDKTSCTGRDPKDNDWVIEYESGTDAPEHPNVHSYTFILKNVSKGKTYEGCKLDLLRTTIV